MNYLIEFVVILAVIGVVLRWPGKTTYTLRASEPLWDNIVRTKRFNRRWWAQYYCWVYNVDERRWGNTDTTFHVEKI